MTSLVSAQNSETQQERHARLRTAHARSRTDFCEGEALFCRETKKRKLRVAEVLLKAKWRDRAHAHPEELRGHTRRGGLESFYAQRVVWAEV